MSAGSYTWDNADVDARFLRALECANLEVREENIVTGALPSGAFDLVHTRWTLMHIPEREEVLLKLIDSLKPGGTLFLEEPDIFPVVGLDRVAVIARRRKRPPRRERVTRVKSRPAGEPARADCGL